MNPIEPASPHAVAPTAAGAPLLAAAVGQTLTRGDKELIVFGRAMRAQMALRDLLEVVEGLDCPMRWSDAWDLKRVVDRLALEHVCFVEEKAA